MKIKDIESDGIGFALGLETGDDLTEINGNKIKDVIDYRFYIAEYEIELKILRNGEEIKIAVEKEEWEDLGVAFEEIQYRDCASKCVFCFVDQNPKGMRQALYFRDEDYRLSFLHGSYFTLNNVSKNDLKRIVEQRLSPLYISVHALDRKIRNELFGVERNDRLLEKINFLVENGIELHTQIVLCPGINDGKVLEDTIAGLKKYFPGVRTIAAVPLGMTKYRAGLVKLNEVTQKYAKEFISYIHKIQKPFLEEFDERFVFLSDEWYLKAGRKLPSLKHYGELYQLENGVGMTRQFIEDIKKKTRYLPQTVSQSTKIFLMTGKLAEPVLNQYLVPVLNSVNFISTETVGIENTFLGSTITVSGLLSGADFIREISKREGDIFLLPPNILNPDGLTLDNYTLEDIKSKTGKNVLIYSGEILELFELLKAA